MKTAIFGGTFNPVHRGHLAIGELVLRRLDFEKILFIPAFIPPHKTVEDPGADVRLEMLKAAVSYNPRFGVSDCEIERRGVSYTIETVRYLVSRGEVDPKPGVILGDDLAEGFYRWKSAQDLAVESRLIIVHRRTAERIRVDFPHEYLDNGIFPVSSSEVRSLVKSGFEWRSYVPDPTARIIESRRLYGL